jgi:hypothetical protein
MGLFGQGATLVTVSQGIVSFINSIIAVLAPIAIVIFFIGLIQYIRKSADTKAHTQAREAISWSLVALFVLFSIAGLLAILKRTFF